MYREFDPPEYFKVRRLFEGHKQYTPVHAVINGSFPGRVFVDDNAEPQTAIVWAIGRWAYIEGDFHDPSFSSDLSDLIQRVIIPASLRMKMNWFELYASNSPKSIMKLESCLGVFNFSRHFESVYVWDSSKYRAFRSGYSHSTGVVMEMTETPLLPTQVYDMPFVSEEFRSRTTTGFSLTIGRRRVAQCRSNGFTNGKEFMIEVETSGRSNRGKGYATATGVALLDHCLETDLEPLWETTEDNTASQRLGEKLGFVKSETYPVFAIEF